MKTQTKNLFLLPALIAGLNLLPAGRVTAQTFKTVYSFSAFAYCTANFEGARPNGLILSGNTLYGTARYGGRDLYPDVGAGTVFSGKTDGTGFRPLHIFRICYGCCGGGDYNTRAALILSTNTLYGTAWTTYYGVGNGTVFAVNTDPTGFTNLHSFTASSDGGLVLSGNTLYGTTNGTVFAVNTDGTGFTNLHSFSDPVAGLTLSGNTLYGTASGSGSGGGGAVFALKTDGTGFTILHGFATDCNLACIDDWDCASCGGVCVTAPNGTGYCYLANSGANPQAGLVLSGNTLYGTTYQGGSSDAGTVFALNTDGTGFTTLHNFTATPYPNTTNSDGANPQAGLVLSGNTLYGTARYGGSSGLGTVFAVNTDGTGFTTLHSFTGSDGASPEAGLILSGNTLYGTASSGGSSGNGTIFSISFIPQLTITPSGTNVILSWPTNVAGFDYSGYTLQFTTNLVSPAVWATNSPAPVVIAGQNTVTNPITGAQKFYRLIH